MAGPFSGTWKASTIDYDNSPLKWGTGINPVHSHRTGDGRNIAPGQIEGTVPGDVTDPYSPLAMGYTPEDEESTLWGYGHDTGTADRPGLDSDEAMVRAATMDGYPQYGPYQGGIPGGSGIRSVDKGSEASSAAKQTPDEDVLQGAFFKQTTYVNDSEQPDNSQVFMQTSMTQRDKVRSGSQRGSGSASEYNAPIGSRIPGMRKPTYSGEQRHEDMRPKEQNYIIRPFWNRQAGTGDPAWMRPNALYESMPLQRISPPDAYQGPQVPALSTQPVDIQAAYGYSDEDVLY